MFLNVREPHLRQEVGGGHEVSGVPPPTGVGVHQDPESEYSVMLLVNNVSIIELKF